jgi:hypothetical protein
LSLKIICEFNYTGIIITLMNTSGITSGGKQFIINSKKYKQIDTIGEGAQGAVYKVVDLLTGK